MYIYLFLMIAVVFSIEGIEINNKIIKRISQILIIIIFYSISGMSYRIHNDYFIYENLYKVVNFSNFSGSHGKYKGENYKKIKKAILFIESDPTQAEEIATLSGKPVFCTTNQMYYSESISNKVKNKTKSSIKKLY